MPDQDKSRTQARKESDARKAAARYKKNPILPPKNERGKK